MPASVSPIVETTIGLVMVYIAFSLLVSWANELISAWQNKRAKTLVAGISQLLGGANSGATQALLNDPIFLALKKNAERNPDYLSAEQFSTILMGKLVPLGAALPQIGGEFKTQIQANATALGIGPQVDSLLAKANGNFNAFVANAEAWYDDQMDRVSGWYKLEAQRLLLALGLAMAVLFNVDSARLIRAFSCDAALRSGLAGAATQTAGGGALTPDNGAQALADVLSTVPLGWSLTSPPEAPLACDPTAKAARTNGPLPWLLEKILGLALTAIALSLGAPFWFDVLSRVTRVRLSGEKPDPSSAS